MLAYDVNVITFILRKTNSRHQNDGENQCSVAVNFLFMSPDSILFHPLY